jgi:stalled ribosome rescue protein Dom34
MNSGAAATHQIRHGVVWLDHSEARIFHLERDLGLRATVRAVKVRARHKDGHIRAEDSPRYFAEIAAFLQNTREVLLAGPGPEKKTFHAWLQRHQPQLAGRVLEVMAMDDAGNGQIVDAARRFFLRADRMLPPEPLRK